MPGPTGNQPSPTAGRGLGAHRRERRSSWRLLERRDFRRYFLGSLVSNLGSWLQGTAQVMLAYQITRSVFVVGLIAFAQFAGVLFVGPWAAVLADRFGSRTMLIGTQWASCAIAVLMAWCYEAGALGKSTLFLGALGLGLAFAMALPVQTALVPRLVAPAEAGAMATDPDTEAAIRMNSVSYNSGRALAPALCVLVFAIAGPGLVFVLNAISFAAFAVVLASLKPVTWEASGPAPGEDADGPPRRAHLADGVRIALDHRRMFLLLAMVAAVTLADDPILVLSPALAHTTLHASSDWAGAFIAALGWGAVLGSVPPTSRRRVDPRSLEAAQRASMRAARSLLVLGVSVIVFATGFSTLVSLLAAAAAGAAALITGAAAQALLVGQDRKAAASVAALWAIAWAGTKPIASLLDGTLAGRFGIFATGIVLACPAIMLALGEIVLPEHVKSIIKDGGDSLASRLRAGKLLGLFTNTI